MSDGNACPHHFTIEHRVLLVSHQYRFNEYTHLTDICPKVSPLFPMVYNLSLRHYNSHINIAIRISMVLGIRAIHHHFRVRMVARRYHSFELSDNIEGLLFCKRCFIHSINSFVVLRM